MQKAIHSCSIICERSESARERRIVLNKSDQQHNVCSSSRFELHRPKALWSLISITEVLGQPAGLSKEISFYAGWLKLICQSEGGDRSLIAFI